MMYKQSTAVIALLLSSSSALQQKSSRSPESEAALAQIDAAPEKVHVLEPEVYTAGSNSKYAFPNPYRTAFYAQRGEEDPAIFGSSEDPDEKASKLPGKKLNGYKGNHLLPAEKVFSLEPVTNREHTTFYDKRNGVWRSEEPQMMSQKPDIGRAGYDKAVRHFVNEDTSVHPTAWPRRETPFAPNGSDPSAHDSLAQRQDVGNVGIHKDVHHFVNGVDMIHPTAYPRSETAFANNGSDPSAHPSSLAQNPHHHHRADKHKHRKAKKDVGEKKIDPEVHGMASSNDMVSPIPNWRKGEPYPPNGNHPSAHPSNFFG